IVCSGGCRCSSRSLPTRHCGVGKTPALQVGATPNYSRGQSPDILQSFAPPKNTLTRCKHTWTVDSFWTWELSPGWLGSHKGFPHWKSESQTLNSPPKMRSVLGCSYAHSL